MNMFAASSMQRTRSAAADQAEARFACVFCGDFTAAKMGTAFFAVSIFVILGVICALISRSILVIGLLLVSILSLMVIWMPHLPRTTRD